MEFERRWLQTDLQTSISYLDSGTAGPGVVILHGLAGSSTEFITTALALPEHRVLLIDQRGHGHSTRRPREVSRAAFIGDVVRVIETEFTHPVALVGQSMGAHTAMLVAASRPDLVQRLVILEGDAGSANPDDHRKLGEFFGSWPVPFSDRDAAARFLGDDPLAWAWATDLEQHADGLRPRFDPDVMVATIKAVAIPRWQEWERVTAPTLVVYAENGMFTDAQKTEFIRRGNDVSFVDLPGGSHDAHLDATDAWIHVLKDFIMPDPTHPR